LACQPPDFSGLPDFAARFPDFLPDFLCIPMLSRELRPLYPEATSSYSSTMDTDGQARGGRAGRSGGVPNYRNDILIGPLGQLEQEALQPHAEADR